MKRPLLIFGIVAGALLMLGPIVGMLGTVFGMQRAFDTLGSSGIKDPDRLSADIGTVLYSTFAGLVAFPIGLLTASICIVFLVLNYRKTPPPLPGGVPPDSAK
jgi:biopolymer transport protein ExbB/TolQ